METEIWKSYFYAFGNLTFYSLGNRALTTMFGAHTDQGPTTSTADEWRAWRTWPRSRINTLGEPVYQHFRSIDCSGKFLLNWCILDFNIIWHRNIRIFGSYDHTDIYESTLGMHWTRLNSRWLQGEGGGDCTLYPQPLNIL